MLQRSIETIVKYDQSKMQITRNHKNKLINSFSIHEMNLHQITSYFSWGTSLVGLKGFGICLIKPSTRTTFPLKLENVENVYLGFKNQNKPPVHPGRSTWIILSKSKTPQSRSEDVRIKDNPVWDFCRQCRSVNKKKGKEIRSQSNMDTKHRAKVHFRNRIKILYSLLTGERESTNPSERVNRLNIPFRKDQAFAITCGKAKPLK